MKSIFITVLLFSTLAIQASDVPKVAKPCAAGTAAVTGAEQWALFETSFTSDKKYNNPFTELQVDVVFRNGDRQWLVPAFWAGGDRWTVRFAPPVQGDYSYKVQCSDPTNRMATETSHTLHVTAYQGDNPLLKHGFVKTIPGYSYFTHDDGTPFFWLADTWWKCLCKRLTWEGFQELTGNRKAKGFSVVQIVCGPYPDENFFAPSLENEGGQPYLADDMSVVNPEYFDYADRRFKHLVDAGIVPAIVGAWGRGDCNSMDKFGAVNIKRHWRYLIARYSAYPVMWILAGEISDETKWGLGPWAEVAKYVREIDPYKHPLTCHTGRGRRGVEGDICLIDYDMVGGSHDEREAVAEGTLSLLTFACEKKPAMPVLCGETCYEGHMQQGFGDVQRRVFWRNMLSGAAGHTYGAAGVWHAGVEGDHGNWGAWDRQPYDWTTWKEGMNYPGSTQLGIGKKLLEQYPWWRFEPHPEWVETGCFAAGIPGEVRFIYLPRRNIYNWTGLEIINLEPDIDWHVYYFDPATGRKFDQGTIKATAKAGDKEAKSVSFKKNVPSPQDWVLVFEAVLKGSSQTPGGLDQDWKSKMTIAERKRDVKGNLLPLQSYDETIRRGMDFLLKDHVKWFKGLPSTLLDEKRQQQPPWIYYSNLQQDGTPFANSIDRFVSYPAFHHALAIRTFLAYWRYCGDTTSLREAIRLADWNIAHSTPADWAYGNLPYSTFQEGKPGGFRDKTGLMPDKAAIMALAYLGLHEATREARFLQAAEAIGMTLSKRQRPNGTWPFRVDPRTQTVIEDYTSSVIYAVMLFEKLDQLNGNHYYRTNRDMAWNWLLNGPVRNKDFRGFYEDIADKQTNRTNYDCLDVIRYLLANRTGTNGYLRLARELNNWIGKVFLDKIQGFEPAEGIREQLECNVVMGIHSLNWASMLLELSKATGDENMRQRAIQTANYITYYLQPDNRIVVGFAYEQWWYSCHMGPVLYLLDFVGKIDNQPATTNKVTRLYLELLKIEPVPVIGSQHSDAQDIPAGFEAGTTVKVNINGKSAYHMVTSTMETLGATRWANIRTEHWISEDGINWRRHKILFRPGKNTETGMWELTASPFFFFDEKEDRWFVYFNFLAYDRIRSWDTPTLLRRAGAKTKGMSGINGEFGYPGENVAPSGIAHPTDAAASSISPPFKAADGKWYAFLGGGPKPFNDRSGKWWVLIVKAKGPEGPFIYMPEHAPEPFMNPTGFVENPLITRIKGPITGKEYWTVIFDYLQPEVTTGSNSLLGFSCSTDGLTWPVQNAQIIEMDKGLPSGTSPWWRAIRVPHQLIDEGNGVYTCFFSAYDKQGEFESIGKATFRVKEIIE